MKLRIYCAIVFALALFLPSVHAATTTLQDDQTVIFDAPDADIRALECCGNMAPPALRPENGSGFGSTSQTWANTDCTEAQGISYSTNTGGFIPGDGEVYVIRTGAGNFFKLRYVNTVTNPTDDTNISFEWEQIAGCSLPPAPTADFTFENTHDVVVQFTDQSTGTVASRSWDFDDGSNTSTFTKPLYAFSGAGTFNVCLTATNIGGSDMVCKDVVVTLDPTAVTITGGGAIDFDADSQNDLDTFSPSGCSDEFFAMAPLDTVSWAGLDKNYDTVVLADAQGASLNTSNFCHSSGTYLETLIVNTTSNNFYKVWIPQNTASGVRYIFELLGVPPPPPTAGFSSSSYGLFASFIDQSSANTTNWAWDFGDGGTSSGASPSHQYASNGTYMVCLTASNAGGSDQNCQNITVNQVATTQVNSNQTIDVDGDSQADLLVEKIVGCGTQAHRFVVQNGTQQSGITKFYPDVIASDALGTSYGTSPFCHPVSPNQTMLLQASSGNFVKVWTPEHTDSFVLFEFEVLTKPEIELQGNGMTISSGDTVPGTADDTDFGNVSLSSNALRTFTILNTDVGDLTIGTITFSGTNLGDFSVSSAPASTVSGNSSTTFDITFTPSEGGLRTATVSIPHNDNDDNENPYTFAIQGSGAAISVIPVSGLITTEAGGTDTFAVSLSTDPSAAVTVPLSSSNTTEGTVPASLVFNPGGALIQTVTVTGVNDDVDDGDQNYTIIVGAAISTDNGFSGIDPPDVSVSNQDDDTAGFTITESDGTTEVEESGTTDTFDVVLTAQPLSDVVITVSSGNTGEATVNQAMLTFTSGDWNQAQTVTVTGVDEFVEDGDQTTTITLSIDDANSDDTFDPLADQTVSVTTIDDDAAGFSITESDGTTEVEESGTADTFDVVLTAQPLSDVVITVSSDDTEEATVDQAMLTFTSANWDITQTVTVTGVDESVDDGDQTTTITLSIDDANSDDTFDPLPDQTVSVTTTDDDTAGFTITESDGTTDVEESGTTDTFDVVLTAQPLSNVVVTVSSDNTDEATVDQAMLTFTDSDWDQAQTVTVTGVDDVLEDGDQTTTITLSIDDANSDDTFDPLADQTVSVTTIDDENDGDDIPADVEDMGPNNGDGNFDSIPDRTQGNVVSLPNAVNGDYITLAVGGGCDQIDNVNVAAEAAMGADPFYDYPLGLLGFELPCSSAQITVFYHSQNGLVGREYRKYGPFIPTSLFSLQFYTLPEVSFGTSNGVTTATFSLSDGVLGDDNTATGATDGKIIDPGGPARSALEPLPAAPIPTLQPWGITLLGLFLAGALARFSRRRRA